MKDKKNSVSIRSVGIQTVKYVGLAFTMPFILLCGVNTTAYFQKELDKPTAEYVIRAQRDKLGIEKYVYLQISEKVLSKNMDLKAFTMYHPNKNDYIIAIRKDSLKEIIIKHEMVHLSKDSDKLPIGGSTIDDTINTLNSLPKEGFLKSFYNYCIPETRANLYALTGILFP